MRVLLDENFPLGLVRALQLDDLNVEHIITLGMRGASDAHVRKLLTDSDMLFLTQDEDFFAGGVAAIVMVSRVRQSRPLADRIEVWRQAVRRVVANGGTTARLLELTDDGMLVPWTTGDR